jgi:hypothetical protein
MWAGGGYAHVNRMEMRGEREVEDAGRVEGRSLDRNMWRVSIANRLDWEFCWFPRLEFWLLVLFNSSLAVILYWSRVSLIMGKLFFCSIFFLDSVSSCSNYLIISPSISSTPQYQVWFTSQVQFIDLTEVLYLRVRFERCQLSLDGTNDWLKPDTQDHPSYKCDFILGIDYR